MNATHTPASGGYSDAGNAGSRYDALLRQIVQLNTDLQKTAALSQTLQRERDDAQQLSTKVVTASIALIESDRKHEELIGKWKKQLEVKARAFESLQKKFAPPRDLEQLRIKIQEELEGPYQQRIDSLQDDVERQRHMSFDMRRELETLKTEYEQFSIDQGNEMECLQETYEVTLNDLRRKLQLAEETAANSQHAEKLRRLEQQRETAQIEIKTLRDEVRVSSRRYAWFNSCCENEKSAHELRLADEVTRNATLELDFKACGRQLTRAKDECESIRSKWEHAQNKLLELTSESERLREQLKQKEALIFSSHNSLSMNVFTPMAYALQDRMNELMLKLQAAEAAAHMNSNAATQLRENDSNNAEHSLLVKAREDELEKYRGLVAEAEKKVAAQEEALRRCQNEAEEATHKLQMEHESLHKMVQALEAEKEVMVAKQTSSHELVLFLKSPLIKRFACVFPREVIQYQEDVLLEREEAQGKVFTLNFLKFVSEFPHNLLFHPHQLKYLEQDYAVFVEKLDKEKENHAATARDLHRKCTKLEIDFQAQRATLQRETRAALSKALRELSKTQKVRITFVFETNIKLTTLGLVTAETRRL
ncbi:hypothetical protein GQ600_12748 [Phytophthora cactorum]|nr:hypothetical protein GQ600_12748 [Phytophthora cactorum]